MPHDVATALAGGGFPTRAGFSAGAAGIEPKPRDRHENMAIANIEGDPFTFPFFSVAEVFLRSHTAIHQARLAKNIGDRARAIVAGILQPRVAAAPFIGHALKPVACGDGPFHGSRSTPWGVGNAVFDHRGMAGIEMI